MFSLVSNWLFANIKKFSVASKECIQWRIKISDAEEAKKAFKTIRNHFWVNGGILSTLPERMRYVRQPDGYY